MSDVIAQVSLALSYPEPLRVKGPLPSLVLRTEDMCVCLLLQDLCVCLLLQDLLQSCSRGGEEESGGTREEPGTLTQGAPVFPGSSRLGIEPKTPGWLVQDL